VAANVAVEVRRAIRNSMVAHSSRLEDLSWRSVAVNAISLAGFSLDQQWTFRPRPLPVRDPNLPKHHLPVIPKRSEGSAVCDGTTPLNREENHNDGTPFVRARFQPCRCRSDSNSKKSARSAFLYAARIARPLRRSRTPWLHPHHRRSAMQTFSPPRRNFAEPNLPRLRRSTLNVKLDVP
jgi:hypothetical protein